MNRQKSWRLSKRVVRKNLSKDHFETVSNFLPQCPGLAILDYKTIIKEPRQEAKRGPK